MALTRFGKVAISSIGVGVVTVFITAAAPAFAENDADVFAENLTQPEYVMAVSDGYSAPKINLLLPPHFQESGSKIG